MHPTTSDDVAVALFVTVRVAPAEVPPGKVKLPEMDVVLAVVFLMVSPERSVNWVVLAPPRNVARPVTPTVLERVAAPETVSKSEVNLPERTVELAEAFLIVSPERSVNWVVLAPPRNVARPVTPTVLERVAAPETVSKSEVNLPERTVELAEAFLIVSPERSVNWVVLAPPRNRAVAPAGVVSTPATEMVVLAVPPKVETPVTPSVPLVKMFVLMVVAA